MLGPAHTSIQFVMPSGPQAFLTFLLSFFKAARTVDLVIGEAKNLLHGLELQIDGLSPPRRTQADSVASTLHCRAVALREQLPCAAMSMMH